MRPKMPQNPPCQCTTDGGVFTGRAAALDKEMVAETSEVASARTDAEAADLLPFAPGATRQRRLDAKNRLEIARRGFGLRGRLPAKGPADAPPPDGGIP
jgi:hypothetical protein